MNRPNIPSTLLAAPAVLAMTAPAAEASTPPDKTAERQVQTLARSILALHEGKRVVNLSRDRQGQPVATFGLQFETSSAGQEVNTGNYSFKLITTATKDGQPQARDPRLLQIVANGSGTGGEKDHVEVEYSFNPHAHSWKVHVDDEHQGPNSSPSPNSSLSPNIGTGGAYWGESISVTEDTPKLLQNVFELAELAVHAATKDESISNFPRKPLPLN